MGLPAPEGLEGGSLRPLLGASPGRPSRAEERKTTAETGYPTDETLVAVRDARWSWIRTFDRTTERAREVLYDRSTDPWEARPLPEGQRVDLSDAFLEARLRARRTR